MYAHQLAPNTLSLFLLALISFELTFLHATQASVNENQHRKTCARSWPVPQSGSLQQSRAQSRPFIMSVIG